MMTGIAQILVLWLASNVLPWPPLIISSAGSAGLTLGFIALAQLRLREAQRIQHQARVNVPVRSIVGVGWYVLTIGWLLSDQLAYRMMHHTNTITYALPAVANRRAYFIPTLDRLINDTILQGGQNSLILLLIILIVSLVPLWIIAEITTRSEMEDTRKHQKREA